MQCEALIWVKKNLQHTKLISCSRAKAYFLYSTWVYNFGGVMPKSKPFLLTSQLIILHNMYDGRVATKKVDRLFKAILTCLFIHTQSPLSSTWYTMIVRLCREFYSTYVLESPTMVKITFGPLVAKNTFCQSKDKHIFWPNLAHAF